MTTPQESSVSRWKHAVDESVIAREEALRRKRASLLYLVVGLVLVAFVGALGFALGRRHRPPSSPGDANAAAAPAPAAPVEAAPADPPLPTDPEEIRKLLTVPTNPVIRITTTKGDLLCELFEDKVPNTVANMVELAGNGFYKGMRFHRVIPGFMAQGGCPNSRQGASGVPGTGGPGYTFPDEFHESLKHDGRGVLSMANSGPNTNGSQFFLCFAPAPHLDGKHSVFGRVIAGKQVLDRLEKIGTPSGDTKEDVRFDIEVVLKQDHPYAVKKE